MRILLKKNYAYVCMQNHLRTQLRRLRAPLRVTGSRKKNANRPAALGFRVGFS